MNQEAAKETSVGSLALAFSAWPHRTIMAKASLTPTSLFFSSIVLAGASVTVVGCFASLIFNMCELPPKKHFTARRRGCWSCLFSYSTNERVPDRVGAQILWAVQGCVSETIAGVIF